MIDIQKEISIHQLSPDRLKDLQKLFFQVFGKRHSIEYLSNKYNTRYISGSYIGHLAYYNSEPVAFTGFIPMPFVMNGNSYLGFQLCDYMTHTDFRRKGIQKIIWERNEEMAKQHGGDFLFALHQGTDAYDKAWNVVEMMNAYVIPLKHHFLRSIVNRILPATQGDPGELLNDPGKQFIHFHERIPNFQQNDIMQVDYNSAYLKYKSFTSSKRYIYKDTYFWLKVRNVLEVGLIDSYSEESIRTGLNALLRLANNSRCSKLIFQVTPNSLLDKILAEKQSPVNGFQVIQKVLNPNLQITKLHLNYCDLDTF